MSTRAESALLRPAKPPATSPRPTAVASRLGDPGEPAHDREVLALLREIRDDIRALRADLRRSRNEAPDLLAALADYFGPGAFTTAGLLSLADDEPHSPLAAALAGLIDMNASPHSRATALGAKLAGLAGVEVVKRQHGVTVYRVTSALQVT